MRRGRWTAIGACTAIVAAGTGLLYMVLFRVVEPDSVLRFLPYVSLVLYAAAPFCASWLSEHPTPLGASAGGLALGIAAAVAAAAVVEQGAGAMPLAFGIAIAGTVALRGSGAEIWARLVAVVLIASYAAMTERFISVLFVYPLIGLADEFADVLTARGSRERVQVGS